MAKMDAEVAAEIKPDAADSSVANNRAGFPKLLRRCLVAVISTRFLKILLPVLPVQVARRGIRLLSS